MIKWLLQIIFGKGPYKNCHACCQSFEEKDLTAQRCGLSSAHFCKDCIGDLFKRTETGDNIKGYECLKE
jgi:hypothetical protein